MVTYSVEDSMIKQGTIKPSKIFICEIGGLIQNFQCLEDQKRTCQNSCHEGKVQFVLFVLLTEGRMPFKCLLWLISPDFLFQITGIIKNQRAEKMLHLTARANIDINRLLAC